MQLSCFELVVGWMRVVMPGLYTAWVVYGRTIATGIFATADVNDHTGLIYGNVHQFIIQIVAAGSAMIYAFVMTYVLARIVDSVMGLRVTENEEYVGLDIAQHGEKAYA